MWFRDFAPHTARLIDESDNLMFIILGAVLVLMFIGALLKFMGIRFDDIQEQADPNAQDNTNSNTSQTTKSSQRTYKAADGSIVTETITEVESVTHSQQQIQVQQSQPNSLL